MSNLTSTATVTVNVNGQQARNTLNQLRVNAQNLETAIAKAAAAGNKTELRRLRKELTDTKAQIRQMEAATMQVEQVLSRLDKATPKELQRTLSTLNKQLQSMERGSAAWKKQTEAIRRVKAEIAACNAQLREQEGFWSRFNRTMNDWQTTMMGAIAAMTGLIMAGRAAVKAFAEMDEQLANTGKYTGMARSDVEKLNEVFKNMDTRTSREQLNLLAQEAGRLGKTTLEDVQGYVEAADIINVALVDLGEGATQTIAKLTNIFRVDEDLGTKEAMLSVGSAVNVLSQNCTASKQFLVEFTQRMAGVGAQAELSIPQLLAFGATLDANGQKTEMSASALGKLTMMLFQKPGEVAAQVGLDVQKFTETLKQSTNEGLLMFLQRIHDLGSKDGLAVLAPLFKDLGMDGVRMSQVLGTLAEHLDMVRWEQEEANKAFNEASSASHEYQIFNNTVQAGLDKAKKRISELSIELGEKLLPIMRHVYSSTSMTLRFLSAMVSFIIEYKTAIITVTAAIAAYTVAVNASNIAFKAHYAWLVITQGAQKALAATTATLRTAWVLLQMGMAKLQGNYARLSLLQTELNAAMSANAFGLMAAAAVALVAVLVKVTQRLREAAQAQHILNDLKKEAKKNAQEEIDRINTLVEAARNENLTMKERQQAVNNLNKIIPNYNAQIDATTGKLREGTKALKDYIAQLIRKYEVEGAREAIKKASAEIADLRIQQEEAREGLGAAKKNMQQVLDSQRDANGNPRPQTSMGAVAPHSVHAQMGAGSEISAYESKINDLERQIQGKQAVIDRVKKVYGTDIQRAELADPGVVDTSGGNGGGGGGHSGSGGSSGSGRGGTGKGGSTKTEDKFKAEDEWKKQQEALNRIAYAKGEKDLVEYQKRIEEIEIEYNEKKLAHTDLTQTERLTIQAAYYEALEKQLKSEEKRAIEIEQTAYDEQLAILKQRYIDGEISEKTYNEASEQLEIAHLQARVKLYHEGSKEYLQAQAALQDKLLANQKRHQQELEAAKKKHADAMAKVKDDVFGDNPQERQMKFTTDYVLLGQVYAAELKAAGNNAKEKLRIEKAYQKAVLALREKYNIKGREENKRSLKEWNEDVLDFLDSDLGKSIEGSIDTLVNNMQAIFQQLSTIIQAELEIQTAQIDKRYEREISLAEGNNYKVKQLEKQKEAEKVKAKKEANKKMFAMEVIQAVAQTASAALNAYSSAAAVPMVGYILAPIAAAAAIAAGGLQIAAIKKQQQASEAQGYARGGFTPRGPRDQEVGVVHAGEWVASQELLANPAARAVIETMDLAQRTNTIGALSAEDVSRTITAPTVLAGRATQAAERPQRVVVENSVDNSASVATMQNVAEVIGSLKKRLDEPFVTVNSVTGELGIKQAQDEYARLMRNKTPKSRRS